MSSEVASTGIRGSQASSQHSKDSSKASKKIDKSSIKLTPKERKKKKKRRYKQRKDAKRKAQEKQSMDKSSEVVDVTPDTPLKLKQESSTSSFHGATERKRPGIEESKEEVISIQDSTEKLAMSRNESAYLLSTKESNDLMDTVMEGLNFKMSDGLALYIRHVLGMPKEVIECLNICLLTDPELIKDFACKEVDAAILNLPMTAILHPHILVACVFAWAFGTNWQRLDLIHQPDEVDIGDITLENIRKEFQIIHQSGIRANMERFIARRLREYHGLPLASDSASLYSKKSDKGGRKRHSVSSSIVVDTSNSGDDASDISEVSAIKPADMGKTKSRLTPLETVREISIEEKGGLLKSAAHKSQSKVKEDSRQKKSHQVHFDKSNSPFVGTLLDLTRLDPSVAGDILERINISRISPKSSSSGSRENNPTSHMASRNIAETNELHTAAGTTPAGKPIPNALTMTPEERHALEYMAKIRSLTPDVREVKRASLPSSVKFNGDIEKFDDFSDAVEGHYRQQQAAYLFNEEFAKQYTLYGADCYVNFSGLTSANQVLRM